VAPPDVTMPGDPGPAIQSGQQRGPDGVVTDTADGSATEASASEPSTALDGPGGHQDPAGNVENQSTTEQ
jgi:hypothetical protein